MTLKNVFHILGNSKGQWFYDILSETDVYISDVSLTITGLYRPGPLAEPAWLQKFALKPCCVRLSVLYNGKSIYTVDALRFEELDAQEKKRVFYMPEPLQEEDGSIYVFSHERDVCRIHSAFYPRLDDYYKELGITVIVDKEID